MYNVQRTNVLMYDVQMYDVRRMYEGQMYDVRGGQSSIQGKSAPVRMRFFFLRT